MLDLFCFFTPYQNNATPLHVASENGHRDIVQSLLRAGADMNIARSDVSDVVLMLIVRMQGIYECFFI